MTIEYLHISDIDFKLEVYIFLVICSNTFKLGEYYTQICFIFHLALGSAGTYIFPHHKRNNSYTKKYKNGYF